MITQDRIQSTEDFNKAKLHGKFHSLFSKLAWKNSDLMSLYEVTSILKPKTESYLGMQYVEVDKIIGSEGRYHDFTYTFYPKKEMLRARWESVDRAAINNIILPPISVFKVGDYYFVRDGNHRVSVAKAQGTEFIDAEVVALDSEIPLEPGMTIKQIKASVVEYERQSFIDQYHVDYLPMDDIHFSSPGSYPEMINHIFVHKYYINQEVEGEIPFKDAAISWFKNVYTPVVEEIRGSLLTVSYPGKTEADLYMWVVREWDDLKRVDEDATLRDASEKMKKETKKSLFRRYFEYIIGIFKKN